MMSHSCHHAHHIESALNLTHDLWAERRTLARKHRGASRRRAQLGAHQLDRESTSIRRRLSRNMVVGGVSTVSRP